MGCMHVRVKPDNSVSKTESMKSKSTVSPMKITQNVTDELNKSKTYPITKYKKSLTVLKPMITALKSNDDRNIGINKTLSEPGESLPSKNAIPSPISIDSKGTSTYGLNISKSLDMDSNVSDIPEVSSLTMTSSELEQLSLSNGPVISSSSDSKHKTYREDAINRFTSVTAIQFNSHQASSAHSSILNQTDDFYSLRHKFVTSISTDSEGSLRDRSKGVKTTPIQPRKANIQYKNFPNKASGKSDPSRLHHLTRNNSTSKDVKLMTDHLVTVLRSTSTRLSNTDYRSNGVISETTSEGDEW
jgi:hypothetical protein